MTPAALSRYPREVAAAVWVPLGAAGGFSGAAVWRGDLPGGPAFCLKSWPADYPHHRLEQIHRWTEAARASGLAFVPAVVPTRTGETVATADGRIWDVTTWMPGTADFHASPTSARLAGACAALARLHAAWWRSGSTVGVCPAVARRLRLLDDWEEAVSESRVVPPVEGDLWHRAMEAVRRDLTATRDRLRPWLAVRLPLTPCVCDVWHDHLLFTGAALTGLIDYGAMKVDSPATDLARLLGDLVPGDDASFGLGLAAYRAASPPADIRDALVRDLIRSGDVCAVANWCLRLARTPPTERALARLATLLDRM